VFEKTKLSNAEDGYALIYTRLAGRNRLAVASEGTGPAELFPDFESGPTLLSDGPGGCMGFAAVPGRDTALLMTSRLYPIFRGKSAGVELLQAGDDFLQPWIRRRIIDLPFVHRIGTTSTPGGDFLFLASICGGKDFQDDWSHPGSVYVAKIPTDLDGPWEIVPVLEGIHRNHGMAIGRVNDSPALVISGSEGVIALPIASAVHPGAHGTGAVEYPRLLSHEVSEIVFLDLDDDGADELVTIEPFHGDTLSVFKESDGAWSRVFTDTIAFGHGLCAGSLGGLPRVFVGQRSGSGDLLCYTANGTGSVALTRSVVDHGTGTAGIAVVSDESREGIATANIGLSEYALYTLA